MHVTRKIFKNKIIIIIIIIKGNSIRYSENKIKFR